MEKEFDLNLFHHQITEVVKFHEVDLMGVCNNAIYFNYFEDARISYVKHLVKKYKLGEFMNKNSTIIMVRNECDYFESAFFEDELIIHTRIESVKSSSFSLLHLVQKQTTGKIIASGGGVVVHFDSEKKESIPLPKEFLMAVEKFEG